MTSPSDQAEDLSPERLLSAYASGIFPMADSRHGRIAWYEADPRGILPLEAFRIPRSLRKRPEKDFHVTTDRAFPEVMRACATSRFPGDQTWINDLMIEAYHRLQQLGYAHSVEAWDVAGDQPRLAGGLYGVSIKGAFFGESMFYRADDASKVCLLALVDRLRTGGYRLLDTQMVTPLMSRFGAIEISRDDYLVRLNDALAAPAAWPD
ncbi:MAG: leucyl/phenylalanyl-tRNA--protein transferase [Phycisphaeraceae bacterium]|nr:leucyl/phenylalanyl-tRNA--protein transferase [Phycisphaeraceae bacterium]